jgi:phosphoglucosamine mutase
MSGSLFGTDGVRGLVGREPITPQTVMKLGWAAGRVFAEAGRGDKVLIGKDTRISGYLLESALEAGFSAAGVNVSLLGPMPTPGIAYLTRTARACAGVVISASHNPFHDNGIKIFSPDGTKLDDALVAAIDETMAEEMVSVDSSHLGRAERFSDAHGRYIEYCKSTFPQALGLNGLRVVVDCANGAGYEVAPRVLTELGAEVIPVANQPDGFNINADCGSTHMQGLCDRVRSENAAVGIALDGDGDRVQMVDENGAILDGDHILYLLANHRHAAGNLGGGVAGTVMTNLGLQQALEERSIPFLRTRVGDRHVHEALSANGWVIGGETSGHIILLDKGTTGDGIVAALEVLQVMLETGRPLSELAAGMTVYPQVMINVNVEGTDAGELVDHASVRAAVRAAESDLGDSGRVVLRPSGTEPLIRVMIEGRDSVQVDDLTRMIAKEVSGALTTV